LNRRKENEAKAAEKALNYPHPMAGIGLQCKLEMTHLIWDKRNPQP
jgi:hypothetical protein